MSSSSSGAAAAPSVGTGASDGTVAVTAAAAAAAAAAADPGMMAEVFALEHATLKHPYERVRRATRASQGAVAAGLEAVCSSLDAAAGRSSTEQLAVARAAARTVSSLRSEMLRCKAHEKEAVQLCGTRLAHLQQAAAGGGDAEETAAAAAVWREQRVSRVIIDHMLRQGCYDTAAELATATGTTDLVNAELFRACRPIEAALLQLREDGSCGGDCGPALAWCEEHAERLGKLKSTLRFRLHLQEFVELVREGRRMEAVAYANRTFPAHAARHLSDIQTVMSLLVFTADTTCEKYQHFFHADRWSDLVQLFRNNTFALNSLPARSTLAFSLQAGLVVLKTPQCYAEGGRNVHCPVCSASLNPLAASLPRSNQLNSTLVCRISGALMNEDNPPTMLPNGYVYSRNALLAMWERRGKITCPRTGASFGVDDLQKVFVM